MLYFSSEIDHGPGVPGKSLTDAGQGDVVFGHDGVTALGGLADAF